MTELDKIMLRIQTKAGYLMEHATVAHWSTNESQRAFHTKEALQVLSDLAKLADEARASKVQEEAA